MIPARHACPICGYLTLEERFNQEICVICFWEDDTPVSLSEDRHSPANKMSVSEAQVNFMLHGIVDDAYNQHNRLPNLDDLRAGNWQLTDVSESKYSSIRRSMKLALGSDKLSSQPAKL